MVQETLQVGVVLRGRRWGNPYSPAPLSRSLPACRGGKPQRLLFALLMHPRGVVQLATGNTRAGDVLSLG